MSAVPAPSPTYIGPPKFHGGAQATVKRLVIHGTVSPTRRGAARGTAFYFKWRVTRPSSAHYCVDPWETIQSCYDHVEAYHAPPNMGSIGIELCDVVAGPAARWWDLPHRLMIRRGARLVGRLHASGVYVGPLVKVDGNALLHNGGVGVCGHSDVRDAWHQTDHWDPGPGFPWGRFMRIAKRRSAALRARHAVTPRRRVR